MIEVRKNKIILKSLLCYQDNLNKMRSKDFEAEIVVNDLIKEYKKKDIVAEVEEYYQENTMTKTELITSILKMKPALKQYQSRLYSDNREGLLSLYELLREKALERKIKREEKKKEKNKQNE